MKESNAEERPLELLGAMRYHFTNSLAMHLGGGRGITRGYGTPGFRLFAGMSWTGAERRKPERMAPLPLPTQVSPVSGVQADAARGVLDACTSCLTGPEALPAVEDAEGDLAPATEMVRIEGQKIVTLEKVHFATNKDVILARSLPLLKQVGQVLRANPHITLVRVEGHTDNQGAPEFNQALSQRRANNVRTYLIQQEGIDPRRIEAMSHGASQPVSPNATAEGRENNRRVEFTILKATPLMVENEVR
jgi:outer membrane protein OmpA-like peptidoglycan-associated protein